MQKNLPIISVTGTCSKIESVLETTSLSPTPGFTISTRFPYATRIKDNAGLGHHATHFITSLNLNVLTQRPVAISHTKILKSVNIKKFIETYKLIELQFRKRSIFYQYQI